MSPTALLHRWNGFRQVVVATGHVTDPPDRTEPRFPESRVDAVQACLTETFRRWDLDPYDLVVCGGARGGDLLAARVASSFGATVWVLLAHPPEQFVTTSVEGAAAHWVPEFWHRLARSPSWVLEAGDELRATDEVYAATNAWMLEVAALQAGSGPLRLVALWDGKPAGGPGGTGEMVAHAHELGATVEIIDPLHCRD